MKPLMSKDKLIPQLRFPKFKNDGEWKEYVLSNITDAIFDGTHQTPSYTESGIPFFSVENIVSGNKNKFISKEDYEIATNRNKPEKGDILLTRIGKIGFSAIVDWDYEFSIYVTLACIKQSKHFNSYYLHTYFQSSTYQKEIFSKSLLNAVPMKINMDELRKTKVLLPPDKEKKEQQKIASCLSSLDEAIAAHSQKLELLKDHKKGLMQNLFPIEGDTSTGSARVPKYRFKEFEKDGEWVEKTIEQVTKVTTGGKDTQNKVDDGKYPFFVRSQTVERINSFSFDGEAILTSGDGVGVGKNFHYINGKFDFHQRVYCIYAFSNDVCGQFVFMYFSQHFYERVMRMSAKNSVDSVRMAMITEMPICLPSKKEQQKIAACLSSLDALITAQAEKIEQLKLHKKGLMQGLFP
jgi:type I restriction enzyme, S subunit